MDLRLRSNSRIFENKVYKLITHRDNRSIAGEKSSASGIILCYDFGRKDKIRKEQETEMIEILIALTLFNMDPPQGASGLEWADELETISSETTLTPSELELPSYLSSAIAKREALFRELPKSKEVEKVAYLDDAATLGPTGTGYSRKNPEYPKWQWFEKHKTMISVDQRVLRTRGDNTLFQDWSPF
ncbi:MAG: hypothetical protein ACU84Q_18655 [Gammaproteobacteria bacterium]